MTSGILFGQGIVQTNLQDRGVVPNTLYEIECWVFIDTSEITPASVHLQLNQQSIAGRDCMRSSLECAILRAAAFVAS